MPVQGGGLDVEFPGDGPQAEAVEADLVEEPQGGVGDPRAGEVRRGEATRQLGLGYRESSLAEETRTAPNGLRAGDRAPDGKLGGTRLFDAFRGPHWTLVAVGVEAPRLPESVRVVTGEDQPSYGKGLFLVRPDGYVGWAGDQAAGLVNHLGRYGA